MMQLKRTLLTLLLSHLVIVMLILIITCVYILPSTKTYSMRLSGINSIAKLRPRILKHHRGTFTLHAFYKNGENDNYSNTNKQNDMWLCNNCSTDPSFGILSRQFQNCAVVGNGGILTNSHCGKEIDSMDFVLRFNMAALKGYRDDVGFKTTIMSINRQGLGQAIGKFKSAPDIIMNETFQERLYSLPKNTILWHCKRTGDSRDYLRTMYDILNRTKHQHNGLRLAFSTHGSDIGMPTSKTWNIPNPTSGLLGFTFATTICNKISMYGFYPFNKDAKNNPLANHYYETGRFKSVIRHVYNREYALFKDLNRTGAIRLVTSQCSYGNNNTNSVD
ncbi:alpha-2,8-sialyltransferase 8B-like isoform X1 [Amphiura filiformis]|uniref:alpha-2,8-sialyltransferase 8B-like isoform X1 n=1 Tax=Amphiura filiformis TaxID=82378 RepID=UPI003B21085E